MNSMFFCLPQPRSRDEHQSRGLSRTLWLLSAFIASLPSFVIATEKPLQAALSQQQILSTPVDNINPQAAGLYLDNMLQLLKPTHSQLGITVWDMTSQKTVFEYNNQSLMQPASVQKLLTALAATKQLGKDFSYQTRLITLAEQPLDKSQIDNGIYTGDIYI